MSLRLTSRVSHRISTKRKKGANGRSSSSSTHFFGRFVKQAVAGCVFPHRGQTAAGGENIGHVGGIERERGREREKEVRCIHGEESRFDLIRTAKRILRVGKVDEERESRRSANSPSDLIKSNVESNTRSNMTSHKKRANRSALCTLQRIVEKNPLPSSSLGSETE